MQVLGSWLKHRVPTSGGGPCLARACYKIGVGCPKCPDTVCRSPYGEGQLPRVEEGRG